MPFSVTLLGWFFGGLPVVETILGHMQDGVEDIFLIDRER
jgi:hypothetical protein